MIDRGLRRALSFIVPYWRRLVLVLLLSALSTALSLYLPLLTRDFFDGALIGKDLRTLIRTSSSTCDCRCIGICSSSRRGSTPARASAT
ncbi:MAG: hypothetical protein HY047_02795 [Acidobacteria bacterium]|nr:hypothetical protein [Acidobacteriota bacterium]